MLAHFENFDLSSLLKDVHTTHVLLFYQLDGDFLVCAQLDCLLDLAKLSLAECLAEFVGVEYVLVPHNFLELGNPLLLLLLSVKVEGPDQVWRDRDIDREKLPSSFGATGVSQAVIFRRF